tara:strand:- start:569 stop:1669 length:1101 start_codon:yes stop_codon:yes gene_type:complete
MKIIFSSNTFFSVYKRRLKLLKELKKSGHNIEVICGDDPYEKRIQELGFKTHILKIQPNKKNPFQDFILFLQFFNFYLRLKPDLVFHSTIKPNIYGSLATRILNIRTINTISGLGILFFEKKIMSAFLNFFYRISQRKVEKIIFQNDDDIKFFINRKMCTINQVEKISGSGVDTNYFDPSKFKKIKNENFTFLFIGRMIKEKGIIEFIKSAKLLTKKYKDIDFIILGKFNKKVSGGLKESEIFELISSNKSIKFNYFKHDIRNIIYQSNCVVLPSWREGMSNILLESCSLKTPVIASNVPGCKEIVKNNFNGFKHEVKNVDDLYKKMELMYNLPKNNLEIFGENGRKAVIKSFNIIDVIDRFKNLL